MKERSTEGCREGEEWRVQEMRGEESRGEESRAEQSRAEERRGDETRREDVKVEDPRRGDSSPQPHLAGCWRPTDELLVDSCGGVQLNRRRA